MFTFIGDHFLYLVLGAFAVFTIALGAVSIVDAVSGPKRSRR